MYIYKIWEIIMFKSQLPIRYIKFWAPSILIQKRLKKDTKLDLIKYAYKRSFVSWQDAFNCVLQKRHHGISFHFIDERQNYENKKNNLLHNFFSTNDKILFHDMFQNEYLKEHFQKKKSKSTLSKNSWIRYFLFIFF